ncbi:hypothetical protein D7V87_07565 [Clostridium sp. 1xD42-85]|nr:hypothetical protein D7V87_07565 [Clostridium sp. 1xD42-85]
MPSKKTVKTWDEAYKSLVFGLERRKFTKTYSVQFKWNALNYNLRTGESYLDIALNLAYMNHLIYR